MGVDMVGGRKKVGVGTGTESWVCRLGYGKQSEGSQANEERGLNT
jgi:hypothetical protein